MRLIALRVSPINCQVALIIPDAAEPPPEWPTGRELVVGDSSAVYVSTFCGVGGDVSIEVWQAEEPPHPHGEPLYGGMLQVRNAGALVGSITGDHLANLALLTEGSHRVRVYTNAPVEHAQWAEHVDFVID
ncbi:MAG TPA: hypothetical protein VHI51_02035 [Ktedonobacterales bacterium]|nr:hypothetical protein [Ktedonobacterales bacterium]